MDHKRLLEVIHYDPETGVFTRKTDTGLNGHIKAGSVAGYYDRKGYQVLHVLGKTRKAHRLAWFYVHGVWPELQIDHKNLIKDDNRIDNLRLATNGENVTNSRMHLNNKAGFKGVTWHKREKKFRALIGFQNKTLHLGSFKTAEEAHAAYCKAAVELYGEFARAS